MDDRYALATQEIESGKYEDAIEDLNAAIELNPGFGATYYLRGVALFNTGKDGCDDLRKSLSMGYNDATRAIEYYCK
jgi:tetratricopeptide (TPR) repeat protein